MNLAEMAAEVEQVNREKGWYDDDRSFGELIALLHSEVSEALEAYRTHGLDPWWEIQIPHTEGGIEVTTLEAVPKAWDSNAKPEGVGSELADVLIRLLDMAQRYGIDLDAEYRRKIEYNKTRPYRHGGKKL